MNNRTLFLDLHAGIGGNMLMAALVHVGVDQHKLQQAIEQLGLEGVRINFKNVQKNGLSALHAHVVTPKESKHRHLADIRRIIMSASLPTPVQQTALRVFDRLAEAEANAHGIPKEQVHFHEVGAADAIVDIVAAAFCLHDLKVTEVIASPPRLGFGSVMCEHGEIPVPAPATAFLLRGIQTFGGDIEGEFTTPTGAAILREVSSSFQSQPMMVTHHIGVGAGDRDAPFPNCVRAFLGQATSESPSTHWRHDHVMELETHLDDMDGEHLGHLLECLHAKGALEVSLIPMTTKKSRPGHIARVLCEPKNEERIVHTLFHESSTIGVRRQPKLRYALPRTTINVETPYGSICVKRSQVGDQFRDKPEFADCQKRAQEANVSVQTVKKSVEYVLAREKTTGSS